MTDAPPTAGPPAVRGVVLAGGGSTRFGDGDKALATLDGRPLVAHVVESVAAGTDGAPVLSVADESDSARLREALDGCGPVTTVVDRAGLSGPLAGIYAAVDAVADEWLFVCACDMPLVSPAGIAAVRDAVDDPSDADAVVPVVDGYDQPLHALYRRSALERARSALAADDAIMALLDRLRVERVAAADLDPIESESTLAAATTNVNTREDLAALRDRSRD